MAGCVRDLIGSCEVIAVGLIGPKRGEIFLADECRNRRGRERGADEGYGLYSE
jgi:hypothetical protein